MFLFRPSANHENQSADSTTRTGFFNGFQLVLIILCECCPHLLFITYTNVKIHSFNVPL